MANVSISFKFLGGSTLSGPIERLQNALSHNYYANTSVYDDGTFVAQAENLINRAAQEYEAELALLNTGDGQQADDQ